MEANRPNNRFKEEVKHAGEFVPLFFLISLPKGVIKIAIQRPFAINISGISIDGNERNTITWRVSGAIQTSFSIEIRNNANNQVILSVPRTNTYANEYILLPSTLTNGLECRITVSVWGDDNTTATSDAVIFRTSSKPIVSMEPITTITSPTYTFTASYSQAESVRMRSWIMYLYDSNQNRIFDSGISTSPEMERMIENLQSEKTYYIEFQATSLHGLVGTTGRIQFNVLYSIPKINVALNAENYDRTGIRLNWNVVQIIGQSENAHFINNEKLDVRNGMVWFDQGFNINDNFTLKIWFENIENPTISQNTEVIISSNRPSNINAIWIEDPNATSERFVDIAIFKDEPTNYNNLWIEDENQTTERVTYPIIQLEEPALNMVWVDAPKPELANTILELFGDNGKLSLAYYNNTFHLYSIDNDKIKTLLDTHIVTGYAFYLYIQQDGDTYRLHAEIVS